MPPTVVAPIPTAETNVNSELSVTKTQLFTETEELAQQIMALKTEMKLMKDTLSQYATEEEVNTTIKIDQVSVQDEIADHFEETAAHTIDSINSSFEESYLNQSINLAWASETENRISQTLAENYDISSKIANTECRESTCRIELVKNSSDNDGSLELELMALLSPILKGEQFINYDEDESSNRIVFYMSKPGFQQNLKLQQQFLMH